MKILIFIQFLIPVLILVSLLTLSPKHGNHEVDENPNFHSLFDPCFDSRNLCLHYHQNMVIMRLMKIQIFIQFLIPVLILVSLLTLSPKHGNHEVDENPNFHSLFDPCFDPSIFANTITKTW